MAPFGPGMPSCGFGGRLLLPVASREAGYRLLASYLPFEPDPEGSTDLRYQINRQRRSGVQPGLLIHRLQTWSVSSVRVISDSAGGASVCQASRRRSRSRSNPT